MELIGKLKGHFTKCLLGGLVAALPVGGLILMLCLLDGQLHVLLQDTPLDFPGVGLLVGVVGLYVIGLTVTTFVGRWLWRIADRLLASAPGLGVLYQTLKQITGYGNGKDALFRQVVLVRSEFKGTLELGLVTEDYRPAGEEPRLFVFVPGSPNPAAGRLVLVKREDCVATEIPIDVALKALFSTGKMGLGG
jgi:uncharacterized membrane protein